VCVRVCYQNKRQHLHRSDTCAWHAAGTRPPDALQPIQHTAGPSAMWCSRSCRQPSAQPLGVSPLPTQLQPTAILLTTQPLEHLGMVADLMAKAAIAQNALTTSQPCHFGLQVTKPCSCWAACSRQGTTNHSSMACCTTPYSPCQQQCRQPPGSTAIVAAVCVKGHSTASTLLSFAAQPVPTPQHFPCQLQHTPQNPHPSLGHIAGALLC